MRALRPIMLAAAVAVALAVLPAASADTRGSSDNWAGYASYGARFSSVSGAWVQPAANCFGRAVASSAASFWVGLGGNGPHSTKVEQIGTDADCDPDGLPDYYAWYELWPDPVVFLNAFGVDPGDRIAATVSVKGNAVVVSLKNMTTGALYLKRVPVHAPDLSSAEWIAEAPAATVHHEDQIVPLTDFGTIHFTHASATSLHGHTGPISDRVWNWQAIDFESDGGSRDPVTSFLDSAAAAHSSPTVLSDHGSAFWLAWKQGEHARSKKASPAGAL